MIDKEQEIYEALATALRAEFGEDNIFITWAELSNTPPKFPAVSIIKTSNSINENGVTLTSLENVVKEEYKVESFSNKSTGRVEETKLISDICNGIMLEKWYLRSFDEPIANADPNVARRITRFKNSIVI